MVNIADDIIVVGRGKSLADAKCDHDCTVIELLNRLSHHVDKVKFKTHIAPFNGHVLTPEWIMRHVYSSALAVKD